MKKIQNWIVQLSALALVTLVLILMVPTPTLHAELPPLPEATPRPTATPTSSVAHAAPKSRIQVASLLLKTAITGDWPNHSVVQWQDSAGNWYDVEGWRGEIVNGQTKWWVEEKDWGDGPFRWKIYDDDDSISAISQPFYLPTTAGQQLIVRVP